MKRLWFIVLTGLVIASFILSACAQPANQPEGGEAQPEAEEPAAGGEEQEDLGTITVATDATWPPFESVNESTRELEGFDIDLMNAIAEAAGLEIEYVNVGFDPLLAGMATCQYDAAISAITITPERQEDFLFSDPYFAAGQIVTVRTENTDITGPESLPGKVVGVQIGTTGAIEVAQIDGAEVRTYDDVGLAFQDLMNGQVDAVVADNPLALDYVRANAGQLKTVGEAFTDESYGIAVCANRPEVQAKINEGLATVKDQGLIEELTQKWLAGGQ